MPAAGLWIMLCPMNDAGNTELWKQRAESGWAFGLALTAASAITLVWRLWLMPHAGMAEVDVPLRIFSALGWIDSPYWPGDDFWLPLHRMLLGPWLAAGDETAGRITLALWFGVVWNITLLWALAWLARGMDRIFWWIPLLAAVISPLLLYQSFVPLADLPAAVCLLAALAAALDARRRPWETVVAVIFALMASMLRYEAWPALAVVIVLLPPGRGRVVAALTLAAFPLLWMTGHFALFGDPLHGIHKAAQWQASRGWTAAAGAGEAFSRMGFVATALLAGFALPVALLGLWGAAKSLKHKRFRWIAAFMALLVLLDLWAVVSGSAFLRSRYFITPAALLVLFAPAGLRSLIAVARRRPALGWTTVAVCALLFIAGPRWYGHEVAEGLIPQTDRDMRLTAPTAAQSIPADTGLIFMGIPPMTAYTYALYLNGSLPGRVRIFGPGEMHPCTAAALTRMRPEGALVVPGDATGSAAMAAWEKGADMTIRRGVTVPKGPAILFYRNAEPRPGLEGCD